MRPTKEHEPHFLGHPRVAGPRCIQQHFVALLGVLQRPRPLKANLATERKRALQGQTLGSTWVRRYLGGDMWHVMAMLTAITGPRSAFRRHYTYLQDACSTTERLVRTGLISWHLCCQCFMSKPRETHSSASFEQRHANDFSGGKAVAAPLPGRWESSLAGPSARNGGAADWSRAAAGAP